MAAATAVASKERVVYYDPFAAGDSGPNLRYPANEDGTSSRQYLTYTRGRIEVDAGSVEEGMVRRHLEKRGFNPDRFKGDVLDEPLHCRCGFTTKNMVAAAAHKKRWADHDLDFLDL